MLISLLRGQSVLRAEKIKICKTLRKPVATCGAEFRALSEDITKELAVF